MTTSPPKWPHGEIKMATTNRHRYYKKARESVKTDIFAFVHGG